jgi:hypothetical protein
MTHSEIGKVTDAPTLQPVRQSQTVTANLRDNDERRAFNLKIVALVDAGWTLTSTTKDGMTATCRFERVVMAGQVSEW